MNPNQCCKFGIHICDDLTNPHRNLVIGPSKDLLIPISTEGYTCSIVMFPYTDDKIYEFQWILLSD